MNRRDLVRTLLGSAGALGLGRVAHAEMEGPASGVQLTFPGGPSGHTIPRDFTGLSYEAAQLANPAFFSAQNKALIDLFKGLSPSGNLRIGGGSSEFTTYSDADPTGSAPFEVFGPDTSKTVKSGTTTTALALRNLRAFLDATNWTCIYGLNLGQGTKENAAREAAAVYRILGPRIVCLQIGNEPDSFRTRYRPATYTPADFITEWVDFRAAILKETPGARFAGPDISNKVPYFTAFAEIAPKYPDVVLLTAHYYAMGPAGSPKSTLEHLLVPEPSVETMSDMKLTTVLQAAEKARLPYRMCEGNSCWDGGKPGVSDTLASALWCADYMLHIAQRGAVGINLHGGGNGFYTPIAGAPSTGLSKRPEYFGIQFARQLMNSTFMPMTIAGAAPNFSAYALESGRGRLLVIINKSDEPVDVSLPGGTRTSDRAMVLTGPSLDSKAEPSFGPVQVPRTSHLVIAPRSAGLYRL